MAVSREVVSRLKKLVQRTPGLNLAAERLHFRRKIRGGYSMKQRRELAARHLRGQGLEIGALHLPLCLPRGARARYVDTMTAAQARRRYPELRLLPLVKVDIIDDGEILGQIAADSLDFLVANHMLEHCQNPMRTLEVWLGKLRVGGKLFVAVPDKRFTFDRDRPVTAIDHLRCDYENGAQGSYPEHLEEWARLVAHVAQDEVAAHVAELEKTRYSIHFHVWTPDSFLEWLLFLRAQNWPFEIESFALNGGEFVFVARKI